MTIAAVDQGTTSTKGAVLRGDGELEVVAQRPHAQRFPADGWVEHDPVELIGNVLACLERACDSFPVEAVGIANQGETVVAWDARTGRPVHPAIVWQDNRTKDRTARLKAAGAEELTLARAGLPLDPYFSASKLAWILDEVDEAAELRRAGRLRLGTTDAYFLDRLCGVYATDITTASRTSLLNLHSGQWDERLCELFGVPGELLPEVRPTTGTFGEVSVAGRAVPVTASVVDQQAALYGHGCRNPGDAKVTFGTGAFALTVAGAQPPGELAGGLLPTIAWQRAAGETVYALDGGVYDAGSAVDWIRGTGLLAGRDGFDAIDAPPAVDRGVVFVPALSGLACPHWDRSASGTWIGIHHGTTGTDLALAVLEGVALLTADVLDLMASHAASAGPVSVDGGLVRSRRFCEFLATAIRRPVRVPAAIELTLLGAALLASGRDAAGSGPLRARVHEPVDGDVDLWRERFGDAVGRARGWRR